MKSSLRLSSRVYSSAALRAAAQAVDAPVEFSMRRRGSWFVIEAAARSKKKAERALGRLANEALNHQLRQKVIRFNRELSAAALAALLERGLSAAEPDPLEELEPQVRQDRQEERGQILERAAR